MADDQERSVLPENAHRVLAPGEEYIPAVPPDRPCLEVTPRSVIAGFVMSAFFSAAVAYLTLKLGQGLEAAIPISILAIGLSTVFARRSTLLENVNVIAIGATSGIVVGGSLFVMPAIYILELEGESSFFQIFFVPLLGAVLGVLILIPLRRYFVSKMHGKLPFPEATACTEVLMTGERGGEQARVLLYAMGIGAAFDGAVLLLSTWRENFTTAAIWPLRTLTHDVKAVFSLNTTAAIAGLGYLIGVRYAAYILAGSFFSYFVVVPLLAFVGNYVSVPIGLDVPPLAQQGAEDLFYNYARYIGIGAIFAAGFMSIIKMLPVMAQAFGAGFREIAALARAKSAGVVRAEVPRNEQDMPMALVLGLILAVVLLIFVYFRFSVLAGHEDAWSLATIAVSVAFVMALLFSAVSAWAVAMISVTPISGMTLMTLLLSAMLLSELGLSGKSGMLVALLIGGVVCTALSMSATLVTEFKIAHWLGATPKRVQVWNIAGSVVAAIVVTAVMMMLADAYGFSKTATHAHPLPAPQGNAMADVLRTIMQSPDPTKLFLYGLGAAIAVIIEMLGVSALAFALGMYIPMEYNSPIMVGALVAWAVQRSAKGDAVLQSARQNRGVLLASGLIAGGALMGVLSAIPKVFEETEGQIVPLLRVPTPLAQFVGPDLAEKMGLGTIPFGDTELGNLLGPVAFFLLCLYLYWDARRAKRDEAGPSLG